jgi:Uma2 family endonuclease
MTAENLSDTALEIRAQPTADVGAIPPLKHGARLTSDEFERRYDAMPHIKKAELIEGVVYMPSPVRADIHGDPHADVMGWLGVYRAATPGVRASDNSSSRLDDANIPQPDASLRIDIAMKGNARIGKTGYIEGPPELLVEVAGTSVDEDLGGKLEAYRRNGVQEYIVWRTQDNALDWFQLVEGEYVPLKPDADGIIESRVFPGLRLAVKALLVGDLATVLLELQKGLQTDVHTAFVNQLRNCLINAEST